MCELIDLRDLASSCPDGVPEPSPAYLLVLRHFLTQKRANEIFEENMAFEWDKQLWNWKQKVVQNKHARHNVCYGDEAQEANFPEGKGDDRGLEQRAGNSCGGEGASGVAGREGEGFGVRG